jgi:predicted N-acetyltransferase YhbS
MVQIAGAVRPPAAGVLVRQEQVADQADIDALIARAFGPGRLAKTAERLREANRPRLDLSLVAEQNGQIVGCVRLWPIQIGDQRLVFLGPFAVDGSQRGLGLGASLILQACLAAADAGEQAVLLVGDLAYFSKLGFEAVDPAKVTLPGPVDPRRVLIKPLGPSLAPYVGRVHRSEALLA